MRNVIDISYFKDALLDIGDYYKIYHRTKVRINEYGEIINNYEKSVVWGSLQDDNNKRDKQGQAGTVEQTKKFYCESKYRIYIDDILIDEAGNWYVVYEYQQWDAYGVREMSLRAIEITEDRNFNEFKEYLAKERGEYGN